MGAENAEICSRYLMANVDWIYSKRFDKDKKLVTLNSGYIFSFSKYEGFSYRLLAIEFLIDDDFNYLLQMSVAEHEDKAKNNSDQFQEKGRVPEKILDYLEILLDSDFKSLKQNYNFSDYDISDIGSQQFLINMDEGIEVNIKEGLPVEYFETDVELFLFEFNEYMKKWVEEKYEAWILNE
ncbi:hypothetical protein [Chryseobacterium arthrosphaerae]|uniref:hypothetical protein n=2 Tax=Chryseobacterium arthrosphaerae TaxID=651561 RepID=UPI00241E77B9|nr:hypothetical protein [Chryseobacterium arthrosphaerae]